MPNRKMVAIKLKHTEVNCLGTCLRFKRSGVDVKYFLEYEEHLAFPAIKKVLDLETQEAIEEARIAFNKYRYSDLYKQ